MEKEIFGFRSLSVMWMPQLTVRRETEVESAIRFDSEVFVVYRPLTSRSVDITSPLKRTLLPSWMAKSRLTRFSAEKWKLPSVRV